MCIAIYVPAGAKVSQEHLHNGWCANSDGGGMAYLRGNKVKVVKSLMKWKDWWEVWQAAREANPSSPFLAHFRIRSTGANDADNTHPFKLKTGAMIHNGTLTGSGADWNSGLSDTRMFVDKFGEHLTYDNVLKHKKAIEEAIGYNKLVFLFNNGKGVIINEESGQWHEGAWFSTGAFRARSNHGMYGGHTRCDY